MKPEEMNDSELIMEILTDDFRPKPKAFRYKKKFSWKAFKKFNWVQQQVLVERYNIIITDHETKQEKAKRILKGFNAKNISKYANEISKSAQEISESLSEMTNSINGDLEPRKRRKRY